MTIKKIVFGGGCFWCTEAIFNMLKGIINTVPGYSGGNKPNPSYEEVCTDTTGHVEVLMVEYDDILMPLNILLEVFFEMHDPTSMDKQGADVGTQYRSVIFYYDDNQKQEIEVFITKKQRLFDRKIVTEVKKINEFYPAEEYHMKYYSKNKGQPYCSYVITPKVEKIKKDFKKFIK
ncbi:MAG: peptide-methionine (S)-S-oxide reductase MsrA [Candidatus Micrarchaeaceae archaeon]